MIFHLLQKIKIKKIVKNYFYFLKQITNFENNFLK